VKVLSWKTWGLLGVLYLTAPAMADGPEVQQAGEVRHRFLKTGWNSQSIAIVDQDDRIEWELTCMDAWALPDGGIVYAQGRQVVRLDADKRALWEYSLPGNGSNHACQPLPGGGFLIGYNAAPDEHYAIELDKNSKETTRVRLELAGCRDIGHAFRQFRKTPEGTYLGVVMTMNKTFEWDAAGKVVRTFPNGHFAALRLPNGNTMISGKKRGGTGGFLVEYDKDANVIWEFGEDDIDRLNLKISMICAFQVLKNGNLVITNTRHGTGYGSGDFPHVFEITRDKSRVVWQVNASKWKCINVIQILDEPGDVYKRELIR